jgi:ribonucleoside-diphosphate reductase beta chain
MTSLDRDTNEPLLQEEGNKYVMFPVNPKYQEIYDLYKKHISTFWVPEEIDLSRDMDDWVKMKDGERHFIKNVLAFFAASDGIVNENLGNRFMNEVQSTEARAFYSIQNCIETIHNETYSLLIDTYIKDTVEKDRLLNAIDTIPCIKKKADWALRWITSKDDSFASRLVAFACIEGIFFSGSFCSIFWLKEKGLMPGLCFSNELISRDEALHTLHAVELYKHIVNRLNQDDMYVLVGEAVNIEKEFITESLPCALLGMNNELMCEYIEFVADRLLVQLGYPKLYNSKNPFDFMDRIGMDNKTNFFEKRVGNYAKATLHHKKEQSDTDNNMNFNPGDDDDF